MALRRYNLLAALGLLGVTSVIPVAAQSWMTGTVTVRGWDGTVSPLAGARVTARFTRDGEPSFLIAETGPKGRYRLEGLPEGRIAVGPYARGYYVKKSGGLASNHFARNCPAAGECESVDFEMARTSVIEGWMVDDFGGPLPGVRVQLRRAPGATSGPNTRRSVTSDDRGYFRMWNLQPGRYELTAEQHIQEYGSGDVVKTAAQEIQIGPGDALVQTNLQVREKREGFSVTGQIAGWEKFSEYGGVLVAESTDGGPQAGRPAWIQVDDGAFTYQGLPRGRYAFHYRFYNARDVNMLYLGTLDVDRDLEGVELAAGEPTLVRGRVVFEAGEPTRLRLEFGTPGAPRQTWKTVYANTPDYTFESDEFYPGRWHVQRVGPGFFVVGESAFEAREATTSEWTVRVSNEFGSIRGRVELGEGAAAHYLVGLRGEHGRQSAQTDDSGQYVFPRVVPGEYEIAVWDQPRVDISLDSAWQSTAGQLLPVTVEAGFAVEIDIDAANLAETPQ